MAVFEKSNKKIGGKRLSDIVYQMLVENVPDEQILINLQQLGLDESRAKQVLSKAKTEFENYLKDKLSYKVEQLVNEKLDKWSSEKSKKDTLLFELKVEEQKKYIDEVKSSLLDEINGLKSDFSAMKLEVSSKMKLIDKTVALLQLSGSNQKMMAIILLIAGVFSLAAGLFFTNSLIHSLLNSSSFTSSLIVSSFIVIILFAAGVAAFDIGYKIYSLGLSKLEKEGLNFITKQKKDEEKSIEDLVKEEDLV